MRRGRRIKRTSPLLRGNTANRRALQRRCTRCQDEPRCSGAILATANSRRLLALTSLSAASHRASEQASARSGELALLSARFLFRLANNGHHHYHFLASYPGRWRRWWLRATHLSCVCCLHLLLYLLLYLPPPPSPPPPWKQKEGESALIPSRVSRCLVFVAGSR